MWRRSQRIRAVPIVAVVVVAAVLAGCRPLVPIWERYQGNPDGKRVAVVGDSISSNHLKPNGMIAGNYEALHAALDPAWSVSIDGQPSATVSSQAPWVDAYGSDPPDVILIELGSNDNAIAAGDVMTGAEPAHTVAQLETAYAAMTAKFRTSCVVVVNNSTRGYNAIYNRFAAEFNAWLVAHHPRVVDWDSISGHTFDGVHPDDVGKVLLADRERQLIETC